MISANPNQDAGKQGGNPPATEHQLTIFIDGDPHQVRPGKWRVSDLKAQCGVDPAKVLAEITPHGLKDLDDGEEITVHQDEKFMTHARTGGSS
ncbi:MAG: hypothetical protein ACRDFX_05585 [Chloroflexota bacterium]